MMKKNAIRLLAVTVAIAVRVSSVLGQSDHDLSPWTIRVGGESRMIEAWPAMVSKGKALLLDADGGKRVAALSSLPAQQRKELLTRVVGSGVVVIHAKDVLDEPSGVGSGFVIHKDGRILTNYHVVRGMASLEVEFRDHPQRVPAHCLAVDRKNDIAVLNVDQLPPWTHVVELAVNSVRRPGDSVWTIGHPNELKNTIGWGDINAVRRTTELPQVLRDAIGAPGDTVWIQTDAVLDHGSSGGPLLTPLGHAVGMNTFVAGRQIGFALFLAHARDVYSQSINATPLSLPLPPESSEAALD